MSTEAGRSVVSVARMCHACRLARSPPLARLAHRGLSRRPCSPEPAPLACGALMACASGLCVRGACILYSALLLAQTSPKIRPAEGDGPRSQSTTNSNFSRVVHRSRAAIARRIRMLPSFNAAIARSAYVAFLRPTGHTASSVQP